MKSLVRSILINAVGLWLVSSLVNGFEFTKGNETLVLTALVLGLVNLFVRPILNILLLPINLLTLGTFRWLVNVGTLFLVTMIVPDFKIVGFSFPGYSAGEFIIPALSYTGVTAFILDSFLLSIILGFLFWLAK